MSTNELQRTKNMALWTLMVSSGTLVCCVLPSVMVAIGAGASLAGLVTAAPQLVWLSANKPLVFGFAIMMLVISGQMLHHARSLPCPIDPVLAKTCTTLRVLSWRLWLSATAVTVLGVVFAFVLPLFQ